MSEPSVKDWVAALPRYESSRERKYSMSWETKLLTGLLLVLIAIVSLTTGVALYLTVNPPPRGTTTPQTFRLALASDRDGNMEIYVMDGDGQNVRRLTENPAWDAYPVWSPDGTQLAFLRLSMTEAGEIAPAEENGLYLINSDGGDEMQLVPITEMRMESAPAWSPDGTQIAYTVPEETGTDTPRSSIYVVSRQGGEPTAVLTNTYSLSNLTWSPDGAYLLFTSTGGSRGPRVSTLDLETGEVTMLGNPAWIAAFSPTGEEVAYFFFGDNRFHAVRPNGAADRKLSDAMPSGRYRYATDLTWSPDGETLFYAVWDDNSRSSEFYSLSVASGQTQLMTSVEGRVWDIDLSPDGQWLAYTMFVLTEQEQDGLPWAAIYCLDVRTGGSRALSEDTSFNGMITWSSQ